MGERTRPVPVSLPSSPHPGLIQQLARPLHDMADVERLLAHLHCAKSRGLF
jgi:hypothetical protein